MSLFLSVFLLLERQLNCARAWKPYYDYVPVMLLEAFHGGAFSAYWSSPEAYLQWIHEEHMEMFFDGSVPREHVRDFSGSGDVHISLAPEGVEAMERMLDNYEDELYVLGDVVDRGPKPIKVLQDMMERLCMNCSTS